MEDKIIDKIKDVVVPKRKTINSEGAYTLTKYGQKMTESNVIDRYIQRIDESIMCKCQNDQYSLIYELDYGIINLKDKLSEYYKSLGYVVEILDSAVNKCFIKPCIYITWAK